MVGFILSTLLLCNQEEEIEPLGTKWIKVEVIVLNGISQELKNNFRMVFAMCNMN